MRNAPSVIYPVGRCAFHGRVLLALGLSAALALGLLCWLSPALTIGWGVAGAMLCLIWAGSAVQSWRRLPVGLLHWDARAMAMRPGGGGGRWRWQGDGSESVDLARVEWMVDAGAVLLVRLHGEGVRGRWVWLEAGRAPSRWDDLRRALMAHT